MATLTLTSVYLERKQKATLARKAKAKGTTLSGEVRSAIDAYLAGVSAGELELLDEATRKVGADIKAMNSILERANARAQRFFKELDQAIRTDDPRASRP
jgi:hypothetical protein